MINTSNININDLVLITSFGEGCYSGATVKEFLLIPKSFYDKNIIKINDFSMSYYELDGKHSETESEINTHIQPTIQELNAYFLDFEDSDCLIDIFSDNFGINAEDLYSLKEEIIKRVNEEMEKLNTFEQSLMTEVLELAQKSDDKDIIKKLVNNQKVIKKLIEHYNSVK